MQIVRPEHRPGSAGHEYGSTAPVCLDGSPGFPGDPSLGCRYVTRSWPWLVPGRLIGTSTRVCDPAISSLSASDPLTGCGT
jgi:hypothetical protein